MRRYLVVANQTLGGEHLIEKVRQLLTQGSCRFHIVVPATPSAEQLTWTEGEATAIAQDRLDRALARLRALGAEVGGEVGDKNPVLAIEDALRLAEFDEIVLSTLAPGISKWLKLDLASRIASRFSLPVTHVVAKSEAA
jgi:GABA permease